MAFKQQTTGLYLEDEENIFAKEQPMLLEIFFIIAFIVMLLVANISFFTVVTVLLVATVLMLLTGVFAMMIKLLPWLILAVICVWIYRAVRK